MSFSDHDAQVFESRSSVKITRTAKGEPTYEVKVYQGATLDEMNALRELAVAQYQTLDALFYSGEAQAA